MTTNATVDVNALFSVKLAPIFQTNIAEMKKLKTQLQQYGSTPVKSWTKLFGECILAITNNKTDPVERINKYKPEFIGEIQIKYPKIDVLNNKTKNEFVVLFAETLSTILQREPLVEPVEPVVEQEESVEETLEEKEVRERFLSNQEAGRDMENGLRQVSYRNDFGYGSGGSQHKKTPRRRKYSKRNNTRRKRTVRKRRSYK